MTAIEQTVLASTRSSAGAGSARDGAHWKQVPRLNMLPKAGRRTGPKWLARGLLLIAVALEVAGLLILTVSRRADLDAVSTAKSQLQSVQKESAAAQASIEALQGKLDAARRQVDAETAGYREVSSATSDWYGGLSVLSGTEVDGVRFLSIDTTTGGEIQLSGTATGVAAMSAFQARLTEVSARLQLENVNFETAGSQVAFTATLKVVQ